MDTCIYCESPYAYHDGISYNCPECGKEWTEQTIEDMKVFDANGNEIKDGDDVTVIRDLKMGKTTIKQGSRAKKIKILDSPYNGHDLLGRFDEFGEVYLKSSVVKVLK
jgi:protein PhnA